MQTVPLDYRVPKKSANVDGLAVRSLRISIGVIAGAALLMLLAGLLSVGLYESSVLVQMLIMLIGFGVVVGSEFGIHFGVQALRGGTRRRQSAVLGLAVSAFNAGAVVALILYTVRDRMF
jgi:hypothetical protein